MAKKSTPNTTYAPNAPRPRMNSPLYEDGPWLKDPMKPDMFRHAQLGDPTATTTSIHNLPTLGKGGSRRAPEALPSVSSAHQANKPNTQYDETGKPNRRSKR